MKVFHIVGSLDKSAGGPSRSVPQTCDQLSQLGVQITLIARSSKHPVLVNTSKNLKVKFFSFWQLVRFGSSLSNEKVDLIHLQHVWDPYIHVMAWWSRSKNIPYIITPRGMLEPWIMSRNPLKKRLAMFLYQRKDLKKATAIHATCEMEMQNIRNLGFQNMMTSVPNGVEISKFPIPFPIKKRGPKKILFLSRIHPKKGIEFLIEAWSLMDENDKKGWLLEIIGNGDENYVKSLRDKLKLLNLQHQVKIENPIFGTKKVEKFRDASIFVLPTFSENFGIVIAEALASYTPVITTIGTPWEELNSTNCGWWIPIGVQSLKKSLEEAMNKSDLELIEMGKNGRALIEFKYSINSVGKQMFEFYKEVLSK